MQKVYGIMVDCGDGSAYMEWYRNKETITKILDDEQDLESHWMNEGQIKQELTFPADLDLEACGFHFAD